MIGQFLQLQQLTAYAITAFTFALDTLEYIRDT